MEDPVLNNNSNGNNNNRSSHNHNNNNNNNNNIANKPILGQKKRNQFRNRFKRQLSQWQGRKFNELHTLNADCFLGTSLDGICLPLKAKQKQTDKNTTSTTTTSWNSTDIKIFPYPLFLNVPIIQDVNAVPKNDGQLYCHVCLKPIDCNQFKFDHQQFVVERHPVFFRWCVYHQKCRSV